MKRTLSSLVLGIALLGAGRVANAEQNRRAEPHWGIRPERPAASSPLDLARWLARRLVETVVLPVPVPVVPPSTPEPQPAPATTDVDEVCTPERVHCPVG